MDLYSYFGWILGISFLSTEESQHFFHLPSPWVVWSQVSCPTLLARGYQSPFPDAFPDPVGRHTHSTRIVINVPYHVRCRGRVKLWHKIPIICYKVPPDFVKVLHRGWQVQLHTGEYVQQCLHIVKGDEKQRLRKTLHWSGNYSQFFEAWVHLQFPRLSH